MRERIDGGAAFPVDVVDNGDGYTNEGMSLRDWFAGQALISMGRWMPDPPGGDPEHHDGDLRSDPARRLRAEWAYAQADAMLKERSK
jgi:hypothetical protein